ncbi:J domain-containing protein [Botrimarina mediterranea]|uniref:J domain-containing protein n=1 Tax=Botrimarina mediterranea TaxID=2528022 RepID=A0A518K8W5_9BACT|nr:J domain-containing protein [Botrimarina mediterranea]QDV74238.1 hypothetical protein Spa11_24380 [Botrimarina mediterranea]QDV78869.1 hypothetical protein K2D_24770 [Planctomycetes bacterium K2D]
MGFFELAAGFDRKDLKRSYNLLLRVYKPEKHPAEFQQIRAAYEDLERRLRYGDAREAAGEANWNAGDKSPSLPQGEAAEAKEPSAPDAIDLESLANRLESGDETLRSAYDELAKKRRKTPPDYYALALIGDAVGPPEEQLFLRWTLDGLTSWPGDSALSQLVYGYLRGQAPIDSIPALLLMISKAVSNDGYYRLTEGAWERLLRERPYSVFVQTLETCEANVAEGAGSDPTIGGRVAFYLFALRHALWKDAGDWKDRALEFVEEHFDQMPEHLVNDLDGLMILREYLAHRAEFVAAHPLRARLDAVLEAAYTHDQIEVDRMMAECQREVLASPETVAEAFPVMESPACQAFYPLWAWVSHEIAARVSPPHEEAIDLALWKGRVIDLLSKSKAKMGWHSAVLPCAQFCRGVAMVAGVIVVAVLVFALCFIPVLYLSMNEYGEVPPETFMYGPLLSIIPTLIACIGYWKRFPRLFDRRVLQPLGVRVAEHCYRRVWRPLTFDFMRRSVLDFFTFREFVTQAAAEAPPDERGWICHYVQQDFGLAVYSIAQRYRE